MKFLHIITLILITSLTVNSQTVSNTLDAYFVDHDRKIFYSDSWLCNIALYENKLAIQCSHEGKSKWRTYDFKKQYRTDLENGSYIISLSYDKDGLTYNYKLLFEKHGNLQLFERTKSNYYGSIGELTTLSTFVCYTNGLTKEDIKENKKSTQKEYEDSGYLIVTENHPVQY